VPETPQIIDCAAYDDGRRVRDINLAEAGQAAEGASRFVWIGLHEPDVELLRQVQVQFGLHDLAIEDAHNAHQRPKLELYGDGLFAVLHTAQMTAGKIVFGETHVFAGRGYIVTVRHGASSSYSEVRARCEAAPKMLKKGVDFVFYSLMDFIVDNYLPVVQAIESEVEGLEEAVFGGGFEPKQVERLYDLKRELLALRRIVTPLGEMTNRLMRFDVPLVDRDTHPYFRDVHDHALRVLETIDSLRDLLTTALEAKLMLASVQQNEVTKKLAGWAAILAVPTAVAGIYGMNFRFMPELESPYGYPAVLLAILGLCGYLYFRFKKAGWF
jgi:magnesium transporter